MVKTNKAKDGPNAMKAQPKNTASVILEQQFLCDCPSPTEALKTSRAAETVNANNADREQARVYLTLHKTERV